MNIDFFCPFGHTGYGNASLNILKSLHSDKSHTYDLSVTPMSNNCENESDSVLIEELSVKGRFMPYDSISIKIWHQFDLLKRTGNGKYFAYPFFEIDTFNEMEKHHLNFPDQLICSSHWASGVLLNNNIKKKISVVPLGVDKNIFKATDNQITKDKYIFITVGKWEIRKSHDIIIECFNKAFENTDNVELWMITHNPFLSEQDTKSWEIFAKSSKLGNKIKIFPKLATQHDVAQAMSYADCGLYISRAEGWNLELLENMAMNRPVIATNFSAHTEYCNSTNSFLVDIPKTTKAIDGKWFHGDGNWADISENEQNVIIDYMRYVYKNNINTNPGGLETSSRFTWENSAKELIKCIESGD